MSVRIGVLSDSHGDRQSLDGLLAAMGALDALCFLGDIASDGAYLQERLEQRGAPTAFYAVRGNNDLIAPGEGGFLRAPRDVSGFTQDIARLLADPALRARMGERNRREMRRYSLEAVLAQMTALYRGLLDGREP